MRRQAAIIRRQAETIRQLVDDLNLTAKLKYSAQPLRKQRLQAAELARKAVSEVLNEGVSDLYELEFLEHSQGEGVYIEGDTVLFERMFCNLIRNSVVHNPQGSGSRCLWMQMMRNVVIRLQITDRSAG